MGCRNVRAWRVRGAWFDCQAWPKNVLRFGMIAMSSMAKQPYHNCKAVIMSDRILLWPNPCYLHCMQAWPAYIEPVASGRLLLSEHTHEVLQRKLYSKAFVVRLQVSCTPRRLWYGCR